MINDANLTSFPTPRVFQLHMCKVFLVQKGVTWKWQEFHIPCRLCPFMKLWACSEQVGSQFVTWPEIGVSFWGWWFSLQPKVALNNIKQKHTPNPGLKFSSWGWSNIGLTLLTAPSPIMGRRMGKQFAMPRILNMKMFLWKNTKCFEICSIYCLSRGL